MTTPKNEDLEELWELQVKANQCLPASGKGIKPILDFEKKLQEILSKVKFV